jgi:aconitate hydratase
MPRASDPFGALQPLHVGGRRVGFFFSLPHLERTNIGPISRLPVSVRIVLESVLRNCDGKRVFEENVRALANWQPRAPRTEEVPFVVARIVLQDFTGVPLLVDLAAMRSAVARLGKNPKLIEPLVPVDLVVDHSVQVDYFGSPEAAEKNLEKEFQRNRERYQFLKWGTQAFETFKVVPPGIGIVHQVNLEYLAQGVLSAPATRQGEGSSVYYPDTLVGTDSHTTMINGLGIVGWGVGGIEAEAGMLGQPVYFLMPDVVGVHLTGSLREGVTATDVALTVTQMLRKARVVGKFVEFYGPGAAALPVVDRATIANMAPEYGATMGFFPMDAECVRFLRSTGRTDDQCELYESYYRAQGMFGVPRKGEIGYSMDLDLDLGQIVPSVAGPKRPQDRIELPALKQEFLGALARPVAENGFGKTPGGAASPVEPAGGITHGSVLIAAITSCTNTSNPSVMLAAGLLAKKAVERGLRVSPWVKTSLAPGSRVVTAYLEQTGLRKYLDRLGFNLVGYGCTTCIGNSGPLAAEIEEAVTKRDLVAASVLSGNRNFEARVHQNIKANFLMSPPLVVAFALAGRVDIDLTREPLGKGEGGRDVYLREIWPTLQEIRDQAQSALEPETFRRLYRDFAKQNPKWDEILVVPGDVYQWDPQSTYIQEPPFFSEFSLEPGVIQAIQGARPLGIFGDSVTTDHISPAGSIKQASPAGKYLLGQGVAGEEFNSYGSRRGNDRVMTRGTFANVRIRNLMVPGTEGGVTRSFAGGKAGGETVSIFEAAMAYRKEGTPLVIIAGQEYGTGSSRDWAAKGTALLGVKAVVAQSFERIHRSNLVGMGILPLQFQEGAGAEALRLQGTEIFDVEGLGPGLRPQQDLILRVRREGGRAEGVPVRCRIDTPIEIEYYQHGGILPCVLRQILAAAR